MCNPALLPAFLTSGAAAGATAAGATAGAATAGATIGSTLQTIGTALAVTGSVAAGINTYNASRDMRSQIEQQKQTEAQLSSLREERSRQQYRSLMAQQRAEVASRGVSLSSPTAVFLGETAAREMVFEAQTIRQGGQATQTELTANQRALRARGQGALWQGGLSAAGTFLTAAPEIWPELLA